MEFTDNDGVKVTQKELCKKLCFEAGNIKRAFEEVEIFCGMLAQGTTTLDDMQDYLNEHIVKAAEKLNTENDLFQVNYLDEYLITLLSENDGAEYPEDYFKNRNFENINPPPPRIDSDEAKAVFGLIEFVKYMRGN